MRERGGGWLDFLLSRKKERWEGSMERERWVFWVPFGWRERWGNLSLSRE